MKIEIRSAVYLFEIDQVVYNKVTNERGMVIMLRSVTEKDNAGKYFTVNQYYIHDMAGEHWIGERILTTVKPMVE